MKTFKMIFLTLSAFVSQTMATRSVVTFDPESEDYEMTIFNFVTSLSNATLQDPDFLEPV